MNKTEKIALREAMIVVFMGAAINFPLQTYLLWLTIDSWQWSDPNKNISIYSINYYCCSFATCLCNQNEISKR